MIFIQIVPPPTPPPPPPGLPIDTGISMLMLIGVVYGILLIRKQTVNYHLDFCPVCKSKKIKRVNRNFIQKAIPIVSKKYRCKVCKNSFNILFFSRDKRRVTFTVNSNK